MARATSTSNPISVGSVGAFAALVSAWLWLFRDTLAWGFRTLTHAQFRLNLALLLGALGVLGVRMLVRPKAERTRETRPLSETIFDTIAIRSRPGPIALMLGAALLAWCADRWLDVSLLSATAFGLGTYGLIGLFMPAAAFRRGFVVALLIVGTLPFGAQADAYLGFLARALSAKIVAAVLAAQGVSAVGAETVLVLENGIAHVDIACSGMRSLWTGGLFFLGATWLEDKRPSPLWVATGLGFVGALILANVFRVWSITWLAVVLDQSRIAEIVHVPLGLVGFVAACAFALLLVRRLPSTTPDGSMGRSAPRLGRRAWILVAIITGLAVSQSRRAPIASSIGRLALPLPTDWSTHPEPLTAAERDLYGRFAHTRAEKLSFTTPSGVSGSALIIVSPSWRSHHPPELCFAGNGRRVEALRDHEVRSDHAAQSDFTVRTAELDDGAARAAYWYQSKRETTESLLDRIGAGVLDPEAFAQVSLVIRGSRPVDDADVEHVLHSIREAVHEALSSRSKS